MNRLLTYGYLGGTLADLQALAAQGALILDVRFSPMSANPLWRCGHLRAVLGDAYEHLSALGNRRYRVGPPVVLADPERGFARLEALLSERPVVLLCACGSPETCHRSLIAEQAAKRWTGLEVEHLSPGVAEMEALDE